MSYIDRGLQPAEDRVLAESFFPLKAGQKIPGRDLMDGKDEKFGNATPCWRPSIKPGSLLPLRVKMRRTQAEQIWSALPR